MSLEAIIVELQSVFSGTTDIERRALEALQQASIQKFKSAKSTPLPAEIVNVMEEEQSHPICKSILRAELDWCPPTPGWAALVQPPPSPVASGHIASLSSPC